MTDYRLDTGTLHEAFGDVETPFFTAQIHYPLDVPEDSPAAEGTLLMRTERPIITSTIQMLREIKYTGKWGDTKYCEIPDDVWDPWGSCGCFIEPGYLGKADLSDGWYSFGGYKRTGDNICRVGFQRPLSFFADLPTDNNGRVRLWYGGNEIEPEPYTGKFGLSFDVAAVGVDAQISLNAPEVRVNGALFDWSQHPGIQGKMATRNYFVHPLDSSGVDIRARTPLHFRIAMGKDCPYAETRPYDLRPVIEYFTFSGRLPNVTAWHTGVDMSIPVEFDASCSSEIWYETGL